MSYWEKESKTMKNHRPPPPSSSSSASSSSSSGGSGASSAGNNFSKGKDVIHGVNPLFRGRRHAPEIPSKKTYPDPSIAIPYLQVSPPTSAEKQLKDKRTDQRYGDSNTLLGQYWLANNYKLEATKDFDGRKPNV